MMDFDLDSDYIVDVYKDGEEAVLGTQLLEVFAVKVSKKCEVYGTILVKDGKRTLCFYNRQPEDCELINQDGSLSLSAPHRPVSATPRIQFLFDLKDKNGDELIKESLLLRLMDNEGNIDELIENTFDKYLFEQVIGRSASATISYMIARVAAQAIIQFDFVEENGGNGHGHFDVYGTIVAYYGNNFNTSLSDDVKQHFSFRLFEKALEDKVQVKYGESIPLLRPGIVVPRYTSIVIELNLEFIHPNGFKEQIKDSKVEFQGFEYLGETVTFTLKHGSMVLTVGWWDTFGSHGTLGPPID